MRVPGGWLVCSQARTLRPLTLIQPNSKQHFQKPTNQLMEENMVRVNGKIGNATMNATSPTLLCRTGTDECAERCRSCSPNQLGTDCRGYPPGAHHWAAGPRSTSCRIRSHTRWPGNRSCTRRIGAGEPTAARIRRAAPRQASTVSTFVLKMSGRNFNPHVSTGVARKTTSTKCWPNRLNRLPSRPRAQPFSS